MPKMRDMLPWHIAYLQHRDPTLLEAGVHKLFQAFKKTAWNGKGPRDFKAGWEAGYAAGNVRVDLTGLGRERDVR